MNKEIIHIARACKAKGNKWFSKRLEIQLTLNLHYNALWGNNLFVTVLGFDTKQGLETFPYTFYQYQSAMESHNSNFQPWPNTNASQAKQANLHRTLEP